jgi:exodeoxyribonuclease VII small subunit
MAKNEIPKKIAEMTFEDAHQAIENYAQGAALKRHCENKLREAQAKIEKISLDANGQITSETVNLE